MFQVIKSADDSRARLGLLKIGHGVVETPAYVVVGTHAAVRTLAPADLVATKIQVVIANTYHLWRTLGDELDRFEGLHKKMDWPGPIMTDSGGFQVFSLGFAREHGVGKIANIFPAEGDRVMRMSPAANLVRITDEGVYFRDGGEELFLDAEKSIRIQERLGADIVLAFDECTSPTVSYEYQKEALDRTHRWAQRSLEAHLKNKESSSKQGLFGIVQGGQYEDLRQESAKFLAEMDDLAGFGIGGSFSKNDLGQAIKVVTEILPENKPRHLLGIGEPEDIFLGVEAGMDTFDCVAPTRIARNGTLYTKAGKINILNNKFKTDFTKVETDCTCYTCSNYTAAYLAHLFRSHEMLGATLASVHNLHFLVSLVDNIRQSILDDNFEGYKKEFLGLYLTK
ncbi:MAG: Queuine tRNA-ribosyltransferase [Candidatus Jorgensenbacteria bacterium GW2011_GWA1_48_11]|uniref:Queuine tRNA-ribosyltransferase n=1 Tax=Candidatus Jorgensenbacteria bacterium GW2011_GWA1_48_11 TaxID=1618660 RepID=A0A0G1UCG8_9BACT|nr:MAG: Queuine tRNA-ribosyltransferase [Candidatus Jorgensenbacteria bacterium GW2011_GWA1_48_11]